MHKTRRTGALSERTRWTPWNETPGRSALGGRHRTHRTPIYDLKPPSPQGECGFKSRPGHRQTATGVRTEQGYRNLPDRWEADMVSLDSAGSVHVVEIKRASTNHRPVALTNTVDTKAQQATRSRLANVPARSRWSTRNRRERPARRQRSSARRAVTRSSWPWKDTSGLAKFCHLTITGRWSLREFAVRCVSRGR